MGRYRGLLGMPAILWGVGLLIPAYATGASVTPEGLGANTMRLLVVRHGEAFLNLAQPPAVPREQLDSLTPRGVTEVTAAGRAVKAHPVAAVIASPTGRTRQTAAIIAREIGFGGGPAEDAAFALAKGGTTADGKSASWEWRLAEWKAGRDPRPAGGESLEDAAARATRAVQALAMRYPGKAVVVVTHSDICAALLGHAAGTPMAQRADKHAVPTGSVSEITVSTEGVWRLRSQAGRPSSGG